jgi:hypothetical protein
MTMEQVKKLILTTNFKDMTVEEIIAKIKAMIKAEVDNPTYVPDIKPAPDEVTTKLTQVENLTLANKVLMQQHKDNTGKIKDIIKDVKNDMTSKWANQAQNAPNMDKNRAASLGFGVKGIDDGHAEPEVTVTNSHPGIQKIDLNSPQVHTLFFRNNITGKRGLPKDAREIEVYAFIGAEPPDDYKKMTYLGPAVKGKYINRFTPDQAGQTVWYFAIYAPRKKNIVAETASKVKAIVT